MEALPFSFFPVNIRAKTSRPWHEWILHEISTLHPEGRGMLTSAHIFIRAVRGLEKLCHYTYIHSLPYWDKRQCLT